MVGEQGTILSYLEPYPFIDVYPAMLRYVSIYFNFKHSRYLHPHNQQTICILNEV